MKKPLAGLLHSPSRFRFRPPLRLTFGFRLLPPGEASSYLRSVLGARGKVVGLGGRDKASKNKKGAICALGFLAGRRGGGQVSRRSHGAHCVGEPYEDLRQHLWNSYEPSRSFGETESEPQASGR